MKIKIREVSQPDNDGSTGQSNEYFALAEQWRKEYAAYFIATNEARNLKMKVERANEEWQAQEYVANNKFAACQATLDAMRKLVEEQVMK